MLASCCSLTKTFTAATPKKHTESPTARISVKHEVRRLDKTPVHNVQSLTTSAGESRMFVDHGISDEY